MAIQEITLENFTSTLFALLDETFEQVHGIYLDRGTSLFETFAGSTAKEASRATSGKCATLAAQVNHVRPSPRRNSPDALRHQVTYRNRP
jgi:hypothetical protein